MVLRAISLYSARHMYARKQARMSRAWIAPDTNPDARTEGRKILPFSGCVRDDYAECSCEKNAATPTSVDYEVAASKVDFSLIERCHAYIGIFPLQKKSKDVRKC